MISATHGRDAPEFGPNRRIPWPQEPPNAFRRVATPVRRLFAPVPPAAPRAPRHEDLAEHLEDWVTHTYAAQLRTNLRPRRVRTPRGRPPHADPSGLPSRDASRRRPRSQGACYLNRLAHGRDPASRTRRTSATSARTAASTATRLSARDTTRARARPQLHRTPRRDSQARTHLPRPVVPAHPLLHPGRPALRD